MVKENAATGLKYQLRKARIQDVKEIQKLVNRFAQEELMLPRSLADLYDNLRDYHVCLREETILGACALHVAWEDLAEIKSLAVNPEFQKEGIGRRLTRACLEEAASLGIRQVFALTYQPGFFEKLGFYLVDKDVLPQKVWGECIKCAKFPDCNEVAVLFEVKG